MPRCNVFGPKDLDVVAILTRACPGATITRFDESGGVMCVFSDDPTDMLREQGLHVIVFEKDLNGVVWHLFIVRSVPGAPAGTEERIAGILRQRFNAKPTGEKIKFEIPIPVTTFTDPIDPVRRRNYEYRLRIETLRDIQHTLEKHGILV
jgi:hypothetical protein